MTAEALRPLGDPNNRKHWESFFGAPPSDWVQWTHQAEAKLLQATGLDPKGNQGRGTTLKLSRQRISRPQAGPQAVGTNIHMSRMRLRIAQHDRLLTLERRCSPLAEVAHLRYILLRTGYPTQEERPTGALAAGHPQTPPKRLARLGRPTAWPQWR